MRCNTMSESERKPAGERERPLAGGAPGGSPAREQYGPTDYAQETGSPNFSKGGHLAGDPLPGSVMAADRDPTPGENLERGSAEPDRR